MEGIHTVRNRNMFIDRNIDRDIDVNRDRTQLNGGHKKEYYCGENEE